MRGPAEPIAFAAKNPNNRSDKIVRDKRLGGHEFGVPLSGCNPSSASGAKQTYCLRRPTQSCIEPFSPTSIVVSFVRPTQLQKQLGLVSI